MSLNAAFQGKTYPPVRFTFDAERVRAFADAIGHRGSDVPPTMLTVPEIEAGLAKVVSDPELRIDLRQVLHGEQSYEWSQSISVGETVVAEATIESIRGRAGLQFLTLRTDVRDEHGELVAVARSTLLVRGDG